MKLKVLLPTQTLLKEEVDKVTAEAENGSFTLLPRHIDFVAFLVPGILSYETKGKEEFLAVDEGILVKIGSEVWVSARDAARTQTLGKLKQTVEEKYIILDEREKKVRSILAKFEADFIRRFMELERHG